ncbi:serine/threonine protein kinase [Vibrio parahaemolyticus]|nr:serine/threonine protein kinase [Vibrio parahaemolyticus]NWK16498.1 serine/threonine protein kinase [Vibrio parahaemolyticus]
MKGPHESGDCVASRYLVKSFLGEGGMQYVYLAHDKLLGRNVALKTPKNDSAEKRFHRSATVSAKINHPNVAKTLDYISEDGRNYLVEELIEGYDLSEALIAKVDFLDPFLVARILHHLAKGLAASHHAGVIHRDLKPTNVMVIDDFQLTGIKITDFGIAKMAEEEIVEAVEGGEDATNASATAVGALPYMAPEAIDTPREVGLKADIWSLGAMTYELLTGSKPFGSGLKAVRHIVTGKYADFPNFLSENPQFNYLTNELISIIKKCLLVSPDDRPSADELVSLCSTLCYQVSSRYEGSIKNLQYNAWGFIYVPGEQDVFYHVESIYGPRPNVGEKVLFSKYNGGGADRALPVLRLKQ